MPTDTERRAQGREWLARWQAAGTRLDDERVRHLLALDDDSAWDEAQALFALWEPDWAGDAGEGLVLQQRLFSRARSPHHT